MTSNAPAQCCTEGFRHEGEPTGKSFQIGKYDAYIAEPKPGKAHADTAILYIQDVLGIWQNAQLLADEYASRGYLTLIIDLFNGDPVALNNIGKVDLGQWLVNGTNGDNPHTKEYVDPIVEIGIKYLKEERGVKNLGAVGYCFGAKYVARHFPAIQVGYMAHPSFVDEPELVSFKGPLSISASETDEIFTPTLRHRSEELLAQGGNPYQITLYGQVTHGFAVRCDLSKKVERFAKEQAFQQALTWFDTWLLPQDATLA